MKIKISSDIPDSTYFRLSDVAPARSGKALTIYTGQGTRRSSWGRPGCTSTIVLNTATFTAVHVGFHHKHRGGQGWFYFVAGQRKLWSQLSLYRKRQVLANVKSAPSWAKHPGRIIRYERDPFEIG